MERLREALGKARMVRGKSTPSPIREAPSPATRNEPASVPTPDVEAAWEALAPLKLVPSFSSRKRLVSLDGGREAAPFDLLRTKIINQAHEHGWRRIAITSPDGGCGKTTTLANLAFSFARQPDMRTMVLDLDLRRPALAGLLSQRPRRNMADVLERRITFAEHGLCYENNLVFGLNGGPARNPSEVLQSQQARKVLAEIEETYQPDLMFCDISPLMASDDNFAFLKNMDCAVIVVAAEQTPIEKIDVAERQVAELTSVMGIVLNKCRYTDSAYGYGYY